jgi:acyl-homoserine-lactone acylase
VNTIAADARGRAVHAQVQVLPNVTDEFAERCNTPLGRTLFPGSGVAVLDGSASSCTPGQAAGALQPGILAPDRYPVLERSDYVTNSNDSHWLSNPAQPQTGFDRIIGDEAKARSLRTRSGLVGMREQLAGGDRFTRADMQELVLANRVHAAELAADETVAMCREVGLGEPCTVLDQWDRRFDVGSRGALLFERFWRHTSGVPIDELWTVPFDPADPVDTPRGLNTASPAVRAALTDAVAELRAERIPLDAPLGDYQYVVRHGNRIPIGGGNGALGVLNMIVGDWVPGEGYREIEHGSSFIQVVSFDGDRCPDARTLLTYAQSNNPASPHYADQTLLFSQKRWVTSRFCDRDILASPGLRVVRLHGR